MPLCTVYVPYVPWSLGLTNMLLLLQEAALDKTSLTSVSSLLSTSHTAILPILALSLLINIVTIGYIIFTALTASNR